MWLIMVLPEQDLMVAEQGALTEREDSVQLTPHKGKLFSISDK
jgi:hypothetical protein